MPIYVDERAGSGADSTRVYSHRDLAQLLRPHGLDVLTTHLPFGDVAFSGNGPEGEILVGIEIKRIGDLISSMRSRRLDGHQLPGMWEMYSAVYLLVEGIIRPGDRGELEEFCFGKFKPTRQRMMYAEIAGFLNSIAVTQSVVVLRSGSPGETARQIEIVHAWWQKPWKSHHTANNFYAPAYASRKASREYLTPKQKLCRDMAAQIPGIDHKSKDVVEKFQSPRKMFEADAKQWQTVKGIGKLTAQRITELLG